MKHVAASLGAVLLVMGAATGCAWGATDSAVTGVVRDTHGSPQPGTLVELFGADTNVLARAITDDHGRYSFSHLVPGSYRVRASAAFLLPAIRSHLTLQAGTQALADLTMTAIFEVGSWLPTESRTGADRSDDWRWALRSSANRPMLRLAADEGAGTGSSSSGVDHPLREVTSGEMMVLSGDGRFGDGGTHQVLSVGRSLQGGQVSQLTANFGSNEAQGAASSVAVAGSLEEDRGGGGHTRLFLRVASHPELQTNHDQGFAMLQTAATETLTLGDAVIIDAGTLLTAERLAGSRFTSAPYFRVAVQPTQGLAFEYHFATTRALQASVDLDNPDLPDQSMTDASGRPVLERSLHQAISMTRTGERSSVSLGVFHDRIAAEAIGGGGALGLQDLADLPILVDPTTDTFRVTAAGYSASGARLVWTEVVSPAVSASLEFDIGSALAAASGSISRLADVPGALHARTTEAVRANLHLGSQRTGTAGDIRYRWQPVGTLTQVDEFDAAATDQAFGLSVRQRLWSGRRLRGLNAVVEASNLLAQGYEPFLGPDGQTLYLAQVPRAIQGGLAFTF